jgi:hypothetical protein
MLLTVGIETIAVNRMRCPDPPNRYELKWKVQNLRRRQMVVMRVRKVMRHKPDCSYKYEVEKEFQPSRMPMFFEVFKQGIGILYNALQ